MELIQCLPETIWTAISVQNPESKGTVGVIYEPKTEDLASSILASVRTRIA